MVNFGLNSASILGIFLAVAGASLYFLRSIRPELSRDQDIFFAAVGLLCGFILLFQGWRLDPILQFGQFLLTGTTIFFAVESIRLRGVATEQAKRNTRIVDDERPVSRRYRTEAELDEEDYEDPYQGRRLKGYPERRTNYRDSYESESRRPKSRGNSERSSSRESSTRQRRSRSTRPTIERYDDWDESQARPSGRSSTSGRSRRPRSDSRETTGRTPSTRKRRPRASSDTRGYSRTDSEAIPTDYVDYQPIDSPEDDFSDTRPRGEDFGGYEDNSDYRTPDSSSQDQDWSEDNSDYASPLEESDRFESSTPEEDNSEWRREDEEMSPEDGYPHWKSDQPQDLDDYPEENNRDRNWDRSDKFDY